MQNRNLLPRPSLSIFKDETRQPHMPFGIKYSSIVFSLLTRLRYATNTTHSVNQTGVTLVQNPAVNPSSEGRAWRPVRCGALRGLCSAGERGNNSPTQRAQDPGSGVFEDETATQCLSDREFGGVTVHGSQSSAAIDTQAGAPMALQSNSLVWAGILHTATDFDVALGSFSQKTKEDSSFPWSVKISIGRPGNLNILRQNKHQRWQSSRHGPELTNFGSCPGLSGLLLCGDKVF